LLALFLGPVLLLFDDQRGFSDTGLRARADIAIELCVKFSGEKD
jgi:hypothetical protein